MEHQFYLDRLSAYFDMELKNEEHAIVHEHIQSCEECQKQLLELEKLENLISANTELSENDYWEQSAQKIESAISVETEPQIIDIKKSSSKGLWWKLTGVAASLVLVAIFAFEQKDSKDELLIDEMKNESYDAPISESKTPLQADSVTEETGYELTTKEDDASVAISSEVKRAEPSLIQDEKQPRKVQKESKETSLSLHDDEVNILPEEPKTVKEQPTKVKLEQSDNELRETPEKIENLESSEEKNLDKTIQIPTEKSVKAKVKSNLSTADSDEKSIPATNDLFKSSPKKKTSKASQGLAGTVQKDNLVQNVQIEPQVNINKKNELDYWRRKVAEHTQQLELQKSKKVRYLKKSTKADESDTKTSIIDKEFTYNELFEAYYKIALITPDSTEENQAIQFLKNHADSVGFQSSAQALYYLELYKADISKQKSRKEQIE